MSLNRTFGLAACAWALVLGLSGCGQTPSTAVQSPTPDSKASVGTSRSSNTPASQAEPTQPDAGNALQSTPSPVWEHHAISGADLKASSTVRVFFGHQSIGSNVLKGVSSLYKAAGLGKPTLVDVTDGGSLPSTGGFIAHSFIGRNGYPLEKIAEFDATLRGGIADQVDVALLKFCYADVRGDRVDVAGIFKEYQAAMSALERDFPDVTFIYATAPLKSETPSDNVSRTQLNTLIRSNYAKTGRLWDLAAIESTTPDGRKVGGELEGQPYDALYPGFTHDGGHLYREGTEVAAAPLLEIIAAAAG